MSCLHHRSTTSSGAFHCSPQGATTSPPHGGVAQNLLERPPFQVSASEIPPRLQSAVHGDAERSMPFDLSLPGIEELHV